MKTTVLSLGAATIALGMTLGCTAQTGSTSQEQAAGPQPTKVSQEQLRTATQKLDKAFADQIATGQVDRESLAPLAQDVVEALPEASLRPQLQAHIDAVIAHGTQKAARMTTEQRAQFAADRDQDKMQIDWYGYGYGYPYYGAGYGYGYPYYGYGAGYGAYGAAYGYSAAYGSAYGYGYPYYGTYGYGCAYGCGAYWY